MSSSWYSEGVSVLFLPGHVLFVIPPKLGLGLPLMVFPRITLLGIFLCTIQFHYFHSHMIV